MRAHDSATYPSDDEDSYDQMDYFFVGNRLPYKTIVKLPLKTHGMPEQLVSNTDLEYIELPLLVYREPVLTRPSGEQAIGGVFEYAGRKIMALSSVDKRMLRPTIRHELIHVMQDLGKIISTDSARKHRLSQIDKMAAGEDIEEREFPQTQAQLRYGRRRETEEVGNSSHPASETEFEAWATGFVDVWLRL